MHKIFISRYIDKALAIGLLLIVLMVGYVFIKYVYLQQLNNLSLEIELKESKNAKVSSILANEKKLRNKISQQKIAINKNKIFLNSNKPVTATSELQNLIKNIIATHSAANILTIKPYPVRKHDDYSETSLEIRIKDIGHKELHKVLYMIESKAPLLFVNELDIRFTQRKYRSTSKSKKRLDRLGVIMVVSGFYRELPGGIQSS
jgi:hypothetical protein